VIKKTIIENVEGRVDVPNFVVGNKEREAFLEYIDKVRLLGLNYAEIEFSAGSEFIVTLQIDVDKNKWTHPFWPKTSVSIRMEERK
jgi:hypothetical protein